MSDVRDAPSTVLIDTSNDEEGIRQLGVTINPVSYTHLTLPTNREV